MGTSCQEQASGLGSNGVWKNMRTFRDFILIAILTSLCIIAIALLSNTFGCKSFTRVDPDLDKSNEIMAQQIWMENLQHGPMYGTAYGPAIDEVEDDLWYRIMYREDPRTGICFAVYDGVPFAVVQCGYARDGMRKLK